MIFLNPARKRNTQRPLYNELTDYYEIIEERDWKREFNLINSIIQRNNCSRIIDLGCGSGYHVNEFAKKGLSALGLDISRNLISFARARAKAQKSGADYVVGNYYHFKSVRKFDAALCLNWSIPVKNQEIKKFLDNSNRLIRNGGLLIFDYERKSEIVHSDLNHMIIQQWETKGQKIARISVGDLKSSILRSQDVYVVFNGRASFKNSPVESRRYERVSENDGSIQTYIDHSFVRFFSRPEIREMAFRSKFKVKEIRRLPRTKYTREYVILEKFAEA